ncbi:MAG TPA: vanadium-dependent haloperoxidase [Saprospiraceae bacterium]|nr:vanadium-dependent haloperoxidase [Saprospiraceae bacterium]HMP14934.1 vanadium-dependent haloperoxidase [Saprospiraceae bacterium]
MKIKTYSLSRAYHLALVLVLLMVTSCNNNDDDNDISDSRDLSKPTREFDVSLAQNWMEEAYNTIKREGLFALDASRVYSYTAIAMYESMVHGIPNGRSLEGQLRGLANLPKPDPNKQYDWGLVLCYVTPRVFTATLNGSMSTESRNRNRALAEYQEQLIVVRNQVSPAVQTNSLEFGGRLAKALIDWMNSDNRTGLESIPYTPPSRNVRRDYWSGDYGHGVVNAPMMPFWWTQRTFVTPSHTLCEPEGPLNYSENPSNLYYVEVKEVYDASKDPAKVAIGHYWANNPGESGSPAGSWIGIANQLVSQRNLDIVTVLQMYTLLSISTRDGFIASWFLKYKYYLQRPVTFIREVISNQEPAATNWVSPVVTPPYPDYTSGTSVNAGSSSTILTRLLGDNIAFTDAQHIDKGYGIRRFNSFREAGIEAFHSRIYGGVHMRRACVKGFEQGACVATHVYNNLKFYK